MPADRSAATSARPLIPHLLGRAEPSFSFEFFPPKDDTAEAVLWDSIRRVEPVAAFVSVTYGAGGSTRDRTVRITGQIEARTTLTTMAHLTCVGASVSELRSVIGAYADAGIRNVLAVRGDPAGGLGMPWTPHPGGLDHADQLVELVRGLGDFTVGVGAFPDRHPESASLHDDVEVLVRKADAGAEFAITQMVTDVDAYLRLRDDVAARRPDFLIVPGLLPVTAYGQLQRMTKLNGQPLARDVLDRLEAVKDDPAAVRAEGIAVCTEHAERMLLEGAPGVHFITMNRSTASLDVVANLGHHARVSAAS